MVYSIEVKVYLRTTPHIAQYLNFILAQKNLPDMHPEGFKIRHQLNIDLLIVILFFSYLQQPQIAHTIISWFNSSPK